MNCQLSDGVSHLIFSLNPVLMGFVHLKYLPVILPHMGDQSGFYRLVRFPILFGQFEIKGGEFQIIHGEFQIRVRIIFVQGGQSVKIHGEFMQHGRFHLQHGEFEIKPVQSFKNGDPK